MIATAPAPSANGQKRTFQQFVTQPAKRQPMRLILYATEGWGKTSFAAQAPEPIFLMTRGETGLWTLMNSGRLPEGIAHFPDPVCAWMSAMRNVQLLQSQQHPFKTLVVDTANGLERLLHEQICNDSFNNDWGEHGFAGFQRGPTMAIAPLTHFLTSLDALRDKGMSVILLAHAVVSTFKNPEGPDFDRFTPAVHKTTWSELHRWADCILFGHRQAPTVTTVGKKAVKGKLTSTDQPRVLITERRPSADAKNRHGLPPQILCGDSPQTAWLNFTAALQRKPQPQSTTANDGDSAYVHLDTAAPSPDNDTIEGAN